MSQSNADRSPKGPRRPRASEERPSIERALYELLAAHGRHSRRGMSEMADRFVVELLEQPSDGDVRRFLEERIDENLPLEVIYELALTAWQMKHIAERVAKRLQGLKQELEERPQTLAPVIAVEQGDGSPSVIVAVHGELYAVGLGPDGNVKEEDLRVGRAVYLSRDRAMIVRASQAPYPLGYEGRVLQVGHDGHRALVDFGPHQGQVWVRVADDLCGADLAGQTVLGDPRLGLITELAPAHEAPAEAVVPTQEVVFAGHWRLKKELEELLVKPLRDPEGYIRAQTNGLGQGGFPRVVLLHGPTGSGKTHAARWVASAAHAVLIERAPAHYRTPLFGQSENLVLSDIERTAKLVEDGQARAAVLVINEAESVLLRRGFAEHSSVQSTLLAIVDSFLAAIDGLAHRHGATPVAVLLTTNMPHLLDAAAITHHRLSASLSVGYIETPEELSEICSTHLRGYEVEGSDVEALAARLADLMWCDDVRLLEATVEGQRRTILTRDVTSPGLVSGLVKGAWNKARAQGKDILTWQALVEAAAEALARHAELIAQSASGPDSPIVLPQFPAGSVNHVRVVFDPTMLVSAVV